MLKSTSRLNQASSLILPHVTKSSALEGVADFEMHLIGKTTIFKNQDTEFSASFETITKIAYSTVQCKQKKCNMIML